MRTINEVVIIGAGPYGLSLAAHLRALGVQHRIFGKAMETWTHHMPKNMTLKSEGYASSLSGPSPDSRIEAWCARQNIPYADKGLPVPLDRFVSYADSFRSRYVPQLEEEMVTSLTRSADRFELTLANGEKLQAQRVVMAVGVSCFAYTPPELADLPARYISHSYDHREVEQFRGKDVAVLGAGSSAIDLAHLLRTSGAAPHLIARANRIIFNAVPDPVHETLMFRLRTPPTKIGQGWPSFVCANAPLLVHYLPEYYRRRAIASHLHPAGGWFMREEVEGHFPISLGRSIKKAEAKDDRVQLTLTTNSGSEETMSFDHVIAATGYEVDLGRVPFLAPGLREKIKLTYNSPVLTSHFETSVPGLYAIGLAAMEMFGPILRFMVGSEFAAPRLAAHLRSEVRRGAGRNRGGLSDPDQLVRLQTEPPLGVS